VAVVEKGEKRRKEKKMESRSVGVCGVGEIKAAVYSRRWICWDICSPFFFIGCIAMEN